MAQKWLNLLYKAGVTALVIVLGYVLVIGFTGWPYVTTLTLILGIFFLAGNTLLNLAKDGASGISKALLWLVKAAAMTCFFAGAFAATQIVVGAACGVDIEAWVKKLPHPKDLFLLFDSSKFNGVSFLQGVSALLFSGAVAYSLVFSRMREVVMMCAGGMACMCLMGITFYMRFPSLRLRLDAEIAKQEQRQDAKASDAIKDGLVYKSIRDLPEDITLGEAIPLWHTRMAESQLEAAPKGSVWKVYLGDMAENPDTHLKYVPVVNSNDTARKGYFRLDQILPYSSRAQKMAKSDPELFSHIAPKTISHGNEPKQAPVQKEKKVAHNSQSQKIDAPVSPQPPLSKPEEQEIEIIAVPDRWTDTGIVPTKGMEIEVTPVSGDPSDILKGLCAVEGHEEDSGPLFLAREKENYAVIAYTSGGSNPKRKKTLLKTTEGTVRYRLRVRS